MWQLFPLTAAKSLKCNELFSARFRLWDAVSGGSTRQGCDTFMSPRRAVNWRPNGEPELLWRDGVGSRVSLLARAQRTRSPWMTLAITPFRSWSAAFGASGVPWLAGPAAFQLMSIFNCNLKMECTDYEWGKTEQRGSRAPAQLCNLYV